MIKNRWSSNANQRWGVSSLETALLTPFIFLFMLYTLQLAFILVSAQVTQYATYMAARSNLVYGGATLNSLNYQYTSSSLGSGSSAGLYTNGNQTAVEAIAEKIIFESLPWEHHRINVTDESDWYMKRVYGDGIDDGGANTNGGAVRVAFNTSPVFNIEGVEVTYCMPVLFTGLEKLFTGWESPNPCASIRSVDLGTPQVGIPIRYNIHLGREP